MTDKVKIVAYRKFTFCKAFVFGEKNKRIYFLVYKGNSIHHNLGIHSLLTYLKVQNVKLVLWIDAYKIMKTRSPS